MRFSRGLPPFLTRTTVPVLLAAVALAAAPTLARAQEAARSLTLGDAARIAASQGATAEIARERAAQSSARSNQTRAKLLPSFSTETVIDGGTDATATGRQTFGATPVTDRTVDFRVRASQALVDLPSLRRWQAASADARAAGAGAEAAEERAAEEGALAYLRVLRADARLAARLADSALAAELLDIARQQLAAGTAIALDVTRSEAQLASAASDLIAGRNERARAELELLRVLALPVDSRLAFADSLAAPLDQDATVSEEEAVRQALFRRGDVEAAATYAEAARRQVSAAKAERLPVISLFGSVGSTADGMTDQYAYGIQVSVPLFDGLNREARIAEGRAREREAEAQWRDAKLTVEVEVRTARLDLEAAREQVAAANVELGLAEQELAQARARFAAGVAGNADVITASLSLNRARDRVVDALTAYHVARVSLASAQGAVGEMR
jgi:outer membrane protein TolC